MRLLIIVMTGALLTAVVAAQDSAPSPAPPNVEIVSKSWRRELLNSKLDEDPFKANDQHRDREREQQQATLINKARSSGKSVRPETPDSTLPSVEMPKDAKTVYFYQAKLKNTGSKTIRSIDWDYVFFEKETKEEVSRFQAKSNVKIEPGKSVDLRIEAQTPPSRLVDATKGAKENQFIEEIVITRVEYADGTIWQRPQK